jgi:L-asparaginase II
VLVEVRRGGIVESRHRGHVVVVGPDGLPERATGEPDALVTLRSAVKPFALVALVEAGGAQAFGLTPQELAIMAASHSGEDLHVRTLQSVFRRANLAQSLLACGAEGMPLDRVTATRLARDGETPGPFRHMCSGFHAASLLLSRHAGWSLQDYWRPEHPSQLAVRNIVGRLFGVNPQTMRTAVDSCGVLTYAFSLLEVARAYAFLADPAGVADIAARSALAPALTRVRDAMIAAPEIVGGTHERLDTAVMKAAPGRIVSKGGAEGLRGVGIVRLDDPQAAGARRGGSARLPARTSANGSTARGMAITIEDGDSAGRASWAATIEALSQVGGLDDAAVRDLAGYHRPPALDPRGKPVGEAVPEFQLAPISELI